MFTKKKKQESDSQNKTEKTESEKPLKIQKTPSEGSRFGSLVLLVITVLASLLFYFWGRINQGDLKFEFGNSTNTWEYSR